MIIDCAVLLTLVFRGQHRQLQLGQDLVIRTYLEVILE